MKNTLVIASISGMTAVILGAFGAHVLKGIISPEMLEVYKTGNQYHFYHSLALLAVGILMKFKTSKMLNWSAILFISGLFLFSGSLYILALTGYNWVGIITPFGGISWIAAWILVAVHSSKNFPAE